MSEALLVANVTVAEEVTLIIPLGLLLLTLIWLGWQIHGRDRTRGRAAREEVPRDAEAPRAELPHDGGAR